MSILQQLAFLLLGGAICSVWLEPVRIDKWRVPAWSLLLLLACAFGVMSYTLEVRAALSLVILAAACYGSNEARTRQLRALCTAVAVSLALLLAVHLVPGFRNPKIIDAVRISSDAVPFTQYLNFDKGAAGVMLLAMWSRRIRTGSDAKRVFLISFMPVATITLVVMGGAVISGLVRMDFKLPVQTGAFLATNLLFTCVPEEAFFRGFVQERLMQTIGKKPGRRWLPIVASGLMFGMVHLAGGLAYGVLATVAGTGYAVAYTFTRKVEVPIIAHFTVNAVQFLAFTYPYLQR